MNQPKGEEARRWINSEEWRLAELLHGRLCRRSHEMDQCWGLVDPYSLNQPRLTAFQRHYLGMARVFMEAFEPDQIDLILSVLPLDWQPETFPKGPM